jgi:hypothetical protein
MNQERIEQYLSGRLSEAEAQVFEEYLLANPEFARQVEFERRLKSGIRQVASGSTAEFVQSNHWISWKLAAAAAIVLAFGAVLYAWHNALPPVAKQVMAAVTNDAQRTGPSMRLALVRGAADAPTLQPGLVRVEIAGLFDLGFHYTISLDRLEMNKRVDTLATLYSQHPASPIALEIMVDSDQLRPGSYSLQVRKQAPGEDPLDFSFLKN